MKRQTLARWTPDLWVAQSRSLLLNSGVFINRGQACLIDPGLYPDEIDALAGLAAAQGAQPATILLTHWHWDHLLGPERFPGVRVVAHEAYARLVGRHAAGVHKEIDGWEKAMGVERDKPFVIPIPDDMAGDGGQLKVGERSLELVHVPGHAADQLAVYEPESRTLWAADILSDVEIPFVSDSLAAYEHTLAGLAAREVRLLVPGHGTPTGDAVEIKRRLEQDRAYLSELRSRVVEAVGQGKSVEQTVAACSGMQYRQPAENALSHRLNVESVYLESGGTADPSQVGWNKDWQKVPPG